MEIQEVAEIWEKVKKELSDKVPDSTFMWIEPLEPIGFENDCFSLLTGHSLAVDIIKKNNYNDFKTAFKKVLEKEVTFEIIYDENLAKRIKKEKERQAKKQQKENEDNKTAILSQMQSYSNLNLKYKFENFVVGSNNEFAHAVALSVAKNPSKKGYNPLFIYGASGLGKTHLMQAIGHYILFNSPNLKVKYLKTEEFTNQLIDNMRKGGDINERMSKFRQKFRNVDVLLLDDIQFLESKKRTMEEVFNTFNTLYDKNKQIVITADRQPKDIPTLPERLISRFEWGIVVDLTPPDFETRFAILKNLADGVDVIFSNEVLELIANSYTKNIRELEGAFNKLCAYATVKNIRLDVEIAKSILKIDEKKKEIKPDDIINLISGEYNVTYEDLRSSARSQNITVPRQITIYLLREILNMSYEDIGEIINKKHTSVLYGYNQIKENIRLNNSFKNKIKDLKNEIKKEVD